MQFSTGFFEASDWFFEASDWGNSEWIGRERTKHAGPVDVSLAGASWIHPPHSGGNTPAGYFRNSFTVPSDRTLAGAELVMADDYGYSAFLNGTPVASGTSAEDAWKAAARVPAQPRPGENHLAANLDNIAKPFAAVVGKLVRQYTDGTKEEIVTDGSRESSESATTDRETAGYEASGWTKATARAS